jgi:hypothetical protein
MHTRPEYEDRCTEFQGSRVEIAVTVGLVSGGVFLYRLAVTYLPIFFTPRTRTVAFEPIADRQQNNAPEVEAFRGIVLSSKDKLSAFSVQRLGPIRADCGANPAVVAVVKPGIMGLFPRVANLDVKDFLPSQARKP